MWKYHDIVVDDEDVGLASFPETSEKKRRLNVLNGKSSYGFGGSWVLRVEIVNGSHVAGSPLRIWNHSCRLWWMLHPPSTRPTVVWKSAEAKMKIGAFEKCFYGSV